MTIIAKNTTGIIINIFMTDAIESIGILSLFLKQRNNFLTCENNHPQDTNHTKSFVRSLISDETIFKSSPNIEIFERFQPTHFCFD